MELLSAVSDSSHHYIITILPDPKRNATIPCTMNVEELIHSSLSLLVVLPLFVFILSRRTLRSKKSHQIFLNLLLVHICFNVSVVVSNFLRCSSTEVVINCSFFVSMFFSLMLLSLQRMFSIKFPFAYRNVHTLQVMIVVVLSWLPGTVFLCVLLVQGATETILDITTTALIAVAIVVLTTSNVVVYVSAKNHDRFVKKHTMRQHMINNTGNGKIMKASYVCFALVGTFVVL